MIRRISHIAIAVLLLVSTTGFTVHQHYCMGSLVETSVFTVPEFCCGEGADCCSNESETYQIDEDFLDFVQIMDFSELVIELPVLDLLYTSNITVQTKPLQPFKILRPPDKGTVLARLQVFCL